MKVFKLFLMLGMIAGLSGCGTSQAPAVNLGTSQYPYSNNWNNNGWNTGWNTGGYQTGWSYGLPGGGTKQVIPVISYYGYAGANKVFMISPQVLAGDQVEVQANGGQVAAQGLFGSSNMIWVTQLKVTLNGTLLGASTYGRYTINQSGVLGLSFEANGLSGLFGNNAQYTVMFPQGGVWINRCREAGGQAINCP